MSSTELHGQIRQNPVGCSGERDLNKINNVKNVQITLKTQRNDQLIEKVGKAFSKGSSEMCAGGHCGESSGTGSRRGTDIWQHRLAELVSAEGQGALGVKSHKVGQKGLV